MACIACSHLLLIAALSPPLVLFICQSLLQVLRSARKKLALASKQPAPEDARRPTSAPGQLYGRIAHSYIAPFSQCQALSHALHGSVKRRTIALSEFRSITLSVQE